MKPVQILITFFYFSLYKIKTKGRERSSLLSLKPIAGEERNSDGRNDSDAVVGCSAAASELPFQFFFENFYTAGLVSSFSTRIRNYFSQIHDQEP